MSEQGKIFIAGGTGYLGTHLIPVLLKNGHRVTVLARPGSEKKVPQHCKIAAGDALNATSYQAEIDRGDTFVHLVGVPHPSPSKAPLFRSIDLPALRASVAAASFARVSHFVYLSVAQPASVMKEYVQTRAECEQIIRESGLNATFLRPWYVLGPGHRWAYALLPLYWLFKRLPSTRETALRLDLVRLDQMIGALVQGIENPVEGIRIVDAQQIKKAQR